jgi:hypothetical protein
MTADKEMFDCVPYQKITLKIIVTNSGTVSPPALKLCHLYSDENGD